MKASMRVIYTKRLLETPAKHTVTWAEKRNRHGMVYDFAFCTVILWPAIL
jgi:hypothetical protein